MALGNADMRAKICAVQAKYCLILLCVDHVLASILTIGAVLYVYLSAPSYLQLRGGYLLLLIPGVLALLTGIGAIGCLLVKRKLIMIICIVWPVLICLIATFFYGTMIYTLATYNTLNYGYAPILMSTTELVLSMLGVIIIPLSYCCCVVLGCLGCCIKSPEESSNGSKTSKGSSAPGGATTTPSALKSKMNAGRPNGNGMNGNGNGGMMNQGQNNQNQNPNNQNWNQNQNNQNPNQNCNRNQNQQNQGPNQNQNWNQNPNNQNQNWNQNQGRPVGNQGNHQNQQANHGMNNQGNNVNNKGMHHKNHSQHFWN